MDNQDDPDKNTMKSIVIIKTGCTLPAIASKFKDFEHWITRAFSKHSIRAIVWNAVEDFDFPLPDNTGGVIITGSHAMVTEKLPWSLNLESLIPSLIEKKIPLLGICYGHQLIARAMGGQVGFNPLGMELGSVDIRLTEAGKTDPLFQGLPDNFKVHVSHSQSVISLPSGAQVLAENDFEHFHAFRIGSNAWGVQFHPEYDISIMKAYIDQIAMIDDNIASKAEKLLSGVVPTPHAGAVLERFCRFCA